MKQVLVMAKIGRPIKFVIRLTPEERTRLEGMIHCGIGALNSALKARILLKTDVSENGPGWSDERIAEALETSLSTVLRTRRQFVEEGLEAALSRKKSSWSPPRTFDGEATRDDLHRKDWDGSSCGLVRLRLLSNCLSVPQEGVIIG